MTILDDLDDFIRGHRPHGTLTGDVTAPAWNGYLVSVTCPCEVVFERWVTPLEGETDLISWLATEVSKH